MYYSKIMKHGGILSFSCCIIRHTRFERKAPAESLHIFLIIERVNK